MWVEKEQEKYAIWDFLDARGRSVIQEWAKNDRLSVRSRAALNQKIRRLSQADFELSVSSKMLAGPIAKHIYKLVIKADVMLRPMLCRGPIDAEKEYTLLLGAVEIGGKLPKNSKKQAQSNRETILSDQTRRCRHEQIPGRP